ncbi:hypothetical protein, partial [Frankia sp. R82]|uniref:hypothetical protein n=1 Tax=Frankia sp. R82 TaxID=2950553 RepID=UPI002043DCDE
LAQAGEHDRAEQIATAAEQIARTITNPDWQARALAGVAGALAQAGEHDRAEQIATAAEQIARTITDPNSQAQALARVAGTLAETRHPTFGNSALGTALAAGDWRTLPFTAVANVSMKALRTIADAAVETQPQPAATKP